LWETAAAAEGFTPMQLHATVADCRCAEPTVSNPSRKS